VAFGSTPLLAVNVSAYVPPVPGPGVPASTPLGLPGVKPTGAGGVPPVSVTVGAGDPVAVTEKFPAVPTANVTAFALVTRGPVCPGPATRPPPVNAGS